MNSQQRLFSRFIKSLTPGELTWIGVRPERKAVMHELTSAIAHQDSGNLWNQWGQSKLKLALESVSNFDVVGCSYSDPI